MNKIIKNLKATSLVGAAAISLFLAGCQTAPQQGYPQQGNNTSYPAPHALEYGYVARIDPLQQNASRGSSGAGIALGAVVGGLLGNQVGKGSGRVAATIAGAVGGGVAGNAIEGRMDNGQQAQGYRVTIKVDNGAQRLYDVTSTGELRVGDRVQVRNGEISRVN